MTKVNCKLKEKKWNNRRPRAFLAALLAIESYRVSEAVTPADVADICQILRHVGHILLLHVLGVALQLLGGRLEVILLRLALILKVCSLPFPRRCARGCAGARAHPRRRQRREAAQFLELRGQHFRRTLIRALNSHTLLDPAADAPAHGHTLRRRLNPTQIQIAYLGRLVERRADDGGRALEDS